MTANPGLSFQPLSPVSFLDRAAAAYSERVAVIDGDRRWTFRQFRQRAGLLAGALNTMTSGRPVAVLAPNTHAMLEAHYGVPWAGAPLVTINTRLSVDEIRHIIVHSGANILIYDGTFEDTVNDVRAGLDDLSAVRIGVVPDGQVINGDAIDYEEMLSAATAAPELALTDERAVLSINYTSGTTGKPKGVMYHHRGAYLQALAMVAHTNMSADSVYLWTLPMFHCHGWTFPWAVTAAGGAHVCMPRVDPTIAWKLVDEENVSIMCGAPTVLSMLLDDRSHHPPLARKPRLRFLIGGAPPTPTILARAEEVGIEVVHIYGLTETMGPAMICDWLPEWDGLPASERARLRARQGISNISSVTARVVTPEATDVEADGQTIGEIALRGNTMMLGYYDDDAATAAAAPDGWFRTGDLGVMHPDGYIELRDRIKDVIISGGENIASVEVEQAICSHPAVSEAAVVGLPDEFWGEVPIAFVTLRQGAEASETDIVEHVRSLLARFKAPKRIHFGELPRTSTGKVQKFTLRDQARRE